MLRNILDYILENIFETYIRLEEILDNFVLLNDFIEFQVFEIYLNLFLI